MIIYNIMIYVYINMRISMWSQISSHLLCPICKKNSLAPPGESLPRPLQQKLLLSGPHQRMLQIFDKQHAAFLLEDSQKPYLLNLLTILVWLTNTQYEQSCSWQILSHNYSIHRKIYIYIRSLKLGSTNIIDLEMYCKSIEIYRVCVCVFLWINVKLLKHHWFIDDFL